MERILVDCHDIHAVVADFVVLELRSASQPNDDDDVEAVADDQALYHWKITKSNK